MNIQRSQIGQMGVAQTSQAGMALVGLEASQLLGVTSRGATMHIFGQAALQHGTLRSSRSTSALQVRQALIWGLGKIEGATRPTTAERTCSTDGRNGGNPACGLACS
jgi:hypothetical protein